MKRMLAAVAAISLLVVGSVAVSAQEEASMATAEIFDMDGEQVGTAVMTETESGVDVQVEVSGLEPGARGIHFHEFGVCEPPGFESAGDHFNPFDHDHGLENPEGPHAGDLPNIEIGEDGSGTLSYVSDQITIGPGEASIVEGDGTALVIHESEDDQVTDPSGESGDPVACGEVVLVDTEAPDEADDTADLVPATGGPGSTEIAGISLMPALFAAAGLFLLGSAIYLRLARNTA